MFCRYKHYIKFGTVILQPQLTYLYRSVTNISTYLWLRKMYIILITILQQLVTIQNVCLKLSKPSTDLDETINDSSSYNYSPGSKNVFFEDKFFFE